MSWRSVRQSLRSREDLPQIHAEIITIPHIAHKCFLGTSLDLGSGMRRKFDWRYHERTPFIRFSSS